jgi:hypothetical protein
MDQAGREMAVTTRPKGKCRVTGAAYPDKPKSMRDITGTTEKDSNRSGRTSYGSSFDPMRNFLVRPAGIEPATLSLEG